MSQRPGGSLVLAALLRMAAGLGLVGMLLFLPAGTTDYPEAWIWLAVLFGGLAVIMAYLSLRDPELLERRLRTRETEPAQAGVVAGYVVVFALSLLVPALDRRFGWSTVPPAAEILANTIVLAGLALFLATLRANRYASRVVEVEEGQVVAMSGPYAIVRHPMYLAISLLLGATPLALGSWWGLWPALSVPFVLARRILNEEEVLRQRLPGYADYQSRVRYRLLPFLW